MQPYANEYQFPIERERVEIRHSYFTEFTCAKGILYILCLLYVTFVSGEFVARQVMDTCE